MLNGSLNRHPVTSSTRIAIALAFLLITSAAAGAALFAQTAFGTIAGSIADPSSAVLPAATLTVTNVTSETQTTLRSDREGRFEFVGLPPGDYVLEASLPGFRNHRVALAVNGQRVDQEIVMAVGTLQETVTVTDDDTPRAVNPASQARMAERLAKLASQTCSGAPPNASGPPIGGNIRPPLKTRHVSPVYPPALRDAEVTGVVTMEALIAVDGSVRDVRVDPSAHPELARVAADAVRQWQFTETLLNCVPIEVEMNVHVSFTAAP